MQMSSKNPFGRIPGEVLLEVTVNKDTDSWRHNRVQPEWLEPSSVTTPTAEHRSAFLGQLREMVLQGNETEACHAELQWP